jgi:hypothetical protein
MVGLIFNFIEESKKNILAKGAFWNFIFGKSFTLWYRVPSRCEAVWGHQSPGLEQGVEGRCSRSVLKIDALCSVLKSDALQFVLKAMVPCGQKTLNPD